MGNRANIVILDKPDQAVFFYSHWGGEGLPDTLRRGLVKGKDRWGDTYLARIIFCEMVGDDHGNLGYGISTFLTDNEHPLLVVDTDRQVIVEYPEDAYLEFGFAHLDRYLAIPFDDYDGIWQGNMATTDIF